MIDERTYGNIRKITNGQGDYYTIGSLLNYPYFKKYYQMITIDLDKQQELEVDPKVIWLISFTGNLDRAGDPTVFFILEEAKETIFDQKLWKYCKFVLL